MPVNFDPEVEIDFPQQYVRFVRYQRKASVLDEQRTTDSNTVRGTIAEFMLTGRGVPKRAIYRSKILDLGDEVNFGRLAWAARTMRMVGEEAVVVSGRRGVGGGGGAGPVAMAIPTSTENTRIRARNLW